MKKMRFNSDRMLFSKVLICISAAVFILTGCNKIKDFHKDSRIEDYVQINLVATSNEYSALRLDPLLANAWGISWSTTGTAWIAAQAGHVSTVYDREGNQGRAAVNTHHREDLQAEIQLELFSAVVQLISFYQLLIISLPVLFL